jgi:hypothetical protein
VALPSPNAKAFLIADGSTVGLSLGSIRNSLAVFSVQRDHVLVPGAVPVEVCAVRTTDAGWERSTTDGSSWTYVR